MKRYLLPLVAFVCGAVVMAFELVGSRVLAPTVGSSLYVWTSLIGIILASLSFGYWYGGRLADREPHPALLAIIIWLAALGIAFTAALHGPFLQLLVSVRLDQRLVATIAALFLFSPAAVALGMVSPFAARLSLQNLDTSGTTVGSLYAASTMGSIIGTFLTGWVLIGYLGTTTTLFSLAGITLAVSFLPDRTTNATARAVSAMIILALAVAYALAADAAARRGFVDTDTRYQRAQVITGFMDGGRPARFLRTDPLGAQSVVYLDGSGDLAASYSRAFAAITESAPAHGRALLLGGGAQVWSSVFSGRYPDSVMDVVEIDPGLVRLASTYFGFVPGPGLRLIHEDGRTFLNRELGPYDLIFMDAFAGTSVPVQLTTIEAVRRMRAMLASGGTAVINIIGAVAGERAALTRSVIATYRAVFPSVRIIPMQSSEHAGELQNIILVARTEPAELPPFLRDRELAHEALGGGMIFTDDFAPVERLSSSWLSADLR